MSSTAFPLRTSSSYLRRSPPEIISIEVLLLQPIDTPKASLSVVTPFIEVLKLFAQSTPVFASDDSEPEKKLVGEFPLTRLVILLPSRLDFSRLICSLYALTVAVSFTMSPV